MRKQLFSLLALALLSVANPISTEAQGLRGLAKRAVQGVVNDAKVNNQKKRGSLLASGLSLSLFTLCSRILGLVREMTKAAFLGTSRFADAFGIAFMIPNLLRRLFAENSISVAFIPTFRGYLESEDNGTTKDFLNATLTLISFCTTVVVIIGIAISSLLIPLFLDSSDSVLLSEGTLLTRIMFPYLFVISIAAFFQGILNGVKIFFGTVVCLCVISIFVFAILFVKQNDLVKIIGSNTRYTMKPSMENGLYFIIMGGFVNGIAGIYTIKK